MSKTTKIESSVAAEDVFEMIELATDDLNTLVRAFDVINDVCQELNDPHVVLDAAPVKQNLH